MFTINGSPATQGVCPECGTKMFRMGRTPAHEGLDPAEHIDPKAWAKLANRVGLKGIRLHDTRHTHASLMLKQGVHPKIVQERLGHASIQITLDTYSHVAPGLQQAAANRFDDIVLTKHQDYSEKEVKEIVG